MIFITQPFSPDSGLGRQEERFQVSPDLPVLSFDGPNFFWDPRGSEPGQDKKGWEWRQERAQNYREAESLGGREMG